MIHAPRLHVIPTVLLAMCLIPPVHSADDHPEEPAPRGSAGELFNISAPPLEPAQPAQPAQPDSPESPKPVHKDALPPVVEPRGVDASGSAPLEAPIWATVKPEDRERRKLRSKSPTDWGVVESEFVWQAPEPGHDTPFERGEWSTDDLFAVPVAGPLHLFTGVEMGGQYAADQSMKVIGRTGVLWRMSLGEGIPLSVRGGPTVKYNDALRPERTKDQGTMEWEVKAQCPLIGPFNLEYLGEALPSMTPDERAQLKQDLNLFIPVNGGKLKFGAKHQWVPGQAEARSTTGLMELYMGIEIGR
jgi:hypothetical protein